MIKVFYKFTTINGIYYPISNCPFELDLKVGTYGCFKCKHHVDYQQTYVLCKHPIFDKKLKVVKDLIK